MENKIKLSVDKIEKDYENAISNLLATKRENETERDFLIRNAYMVAHYNEIDSFFCDVDYDDFFDEEEELLEKIINSNKNTIEHIYQNWLDYCHPERYNFFCYECLWDIIKDALRTL